jgi:transposase InsO family protein
VLSLLAFGLACFACGCWLGSRLPLALLGVHRWAARLWWRWRSRRRGGRRPISPELIALIRQISFENPLWGAPRIHGELLKLGFQLAQSTVSKYMLPRKGRAAQSFATFLRNHAGAIAAIDMLTVRTLALQCLYAFIVMSRDRRRILHIEAANRPTALWLAHEIGAAFANQTIPDVLVRDNDGAYGAVFRRQLRAMGVRDSPTEPHSPWQNGHVERLIGSIRRECPDHHIILNARHLRRVLWRYGEYYNTDRTHLALGKDAPHSRLIERRGRIVSRPILGGLHRRYARIDGK